MKYLLKFLEYNLLLILLIVLIFNVYSLISVKILNKDIASINGYALLEVVSGSMEETIKIGDLIVINENDDDFKVNDIATFRDENGVFVTHRIVEVTDDGFVTKGDNNDSIDQGIRVREEMVGKYVFRLPMLGLILSSLKNPVTLLMILFVGVVVCILISTDSNLKPLDINEDDEEFIEFLKNEKKQKKVKDSKKEIKKSSSKKKDDSKMVKKETKSRETKKNSQEVISKKGKK